MAKQVTCTECGQKAVQRVTESCRLRDGLEVAALAHLRCKECGARFFEDAAMRQIRNCREESLASHA
jgi:hypothetical protein